METKLSDRVALDHKADWLEKLKSEGYVVIKQVLTEEEVGEAKRLVWDWLESLGSGIGRWESGTWVDENWPGKFDDGITTSNGAAQSKAAWYVRGVAAVREAFSSVWNTAELITSMDALIIWRPWWLAGANKWKPGLGLGLHMDQNPFTQPGFQCVQGMVPLFRATGPVGGLRIVPKTHLEEAQMAIREQNENLKSAGRFCKVKNQEYQNTWKLVLAEPGDLILWDSRLVHGSHRGPGMAADKMESVDLARCAVTVCMMPREGVPEDTIEKRKDAVRRGICMSHLPIKYEPHSLGDSNGQNISYVYQKPQLSDNQLELI
eukprot:GFUD01069490.1.p1 GENE.GFUD01069490.1~~GFUD01069490.1.p1  ORF type:complete len:330 (-),score=88.17 GFUD01069490.1:56-1012(-)